MPTFCPPSGIAALTVLQRLSLSSITPEASIYYTLDGTVPTLQHSTVFNPANPISLSNTTTVKAMASAPGYGVSPVTEVEYVLSGGTLLAKVAAPVFSQNGGNARIHDKISISSENGTDIYWTASRNFTTPTECHWKSKVSGLVIVNFGSRTSSQVTISAFSAKDGHQYSDVRSATFMVDIADEDFSIGVGASRIKLKESDEL